MKKKTNKHWKYKSIALHYIRVKFKFTCIPSFTLVFSLGQDTEGRSSGRVHIRLSVKRVGCPLMARG